MSSSKGSRPNALRSSRRTSAAKQSRRTANAAAAPTAVPPIVPLEKQLIEQFRHLRLPMFRDHFARGAERAATEGQNHVECLAELTNLECEARRQGRIKRLIGRSCLPLSKTWESFDFGRFPLHVTRQLESLREGSFLDRRENVLIFGKPGADKFACAVRLGRATGTSRPEHAADNLQPAGPAAVGGQTGSAPGEDDQAAVDVRWSDHRRPGLRAAESRGDGSPVHATGRPLRARQRAADEQPDVQQMGPDLQRPDDDGRGDRPTGASRRDHRAERAQLPHRNGQGEQAYGSLAGRLNAALNFMTGNPSCR